MLFEQLKKDRMEAMKLKSSIEKGLFNIHEVKMNLLSTLIGETSKQVKEPSDESVISTIKKFLKNADELQDVLKNMSNDTTQVDAEIEILESYLPKQLTEEEIRTIIGEYLKYIKENWTKPTNLGEVMSYMKQEYSGRYDGALVSKIAKESLSKGN